MNRKKNYWVIVSLAALCSFLLLMFGSVAAEDEAASTYTGAKKCKTCHMKKKSGAQYTIWQESAHAGAYATLQTEEANAIAKKKGLEVPAAEASECLGCHTTAYGASADVRGKLTLEEGVSCEACHGAGSGYYKMGTMKKISAGEIEAASVGLVEPTEETCKSCHNEKSPTFKEFDFKAMSAKIAHPVPVAVEVTE